MPTRTVNLKMVLGRKEATAEMRRALWTTHTKINQAVASIERMLLLCRGTSYWTLDEKKEEIPVLESQVVGRALKMARHAQKSNGKANIGSDEDVLLALRLLYEQIVPSCRLDDKGAPLKGEAQASNAWVSPLMDPASQGGLSVYSKVLDPQPPWIEDMKLDRTGWEEDSMKWLHGEDGQRLTRAAGSPPGWVRKLRNGQPWQDAFIKDQEKKRKELESGNAPVIKHLRRLGLLPLLRPTFRHMLGPDGKGVSVWDRLAMRRAVEHFLTWESWNHKTRKAHERVRSDLEGLKGECRVLESTFTIFRAYERERHAELKRVALVDDARPYKIGARAIRAWERVREAWLKNGKTPENRIEVCKKLQTKLRGKFGDPEVFRWLAREGHESLWKDFDSLTPLVKLNIAERLLEKRKKYSLMTFADARLHPRWAMYEAPGGTNLRNHTISLTGTALQVRLPLLIQEAEGPLKEKYFDISLAPSGQLSDLTIEEQQDGRKKRWKYRSAHQSFEAIPGGAELLFDRPYLENGERKDDHFYQRPGPIWFKLTLDVQSQAPTVWLDENGRVATPPEVHHFKTALANKSKHEDKTKPGLRVLSVDLGMRAFASCSVFQLVRGKPESGLCFPASDGRDEIDPDKLWARHERSFRLTLPGETPTRREIEARVSAKKEIGSFRRDIGRLKDILRLSVALDETKRGERLRAFLDSFDDDQTGSELSSDTFVGLDDRRFQTTPELWEQRCRYFYDQAEKVVANRFGHWRTHTRARPVSWEDWRERRSYAGGKSIWMIEYLQAIRKLILSWNLRGRTYGAVNRQDKRLFGRMASGLLHHINKLKKDRTKSGADLIVQAALGRVPTEEGSGWRQKYEPCRVILFEDLARYRFRVDRPRRENSQLMRWCHREIIAEATGQAEVYGLVLETTAAGFSSRYLASNGAPGVRCRCLRPDDFENGLPKPYVVYELEWMLGNSKAKELMELQTAVNNIIEPGMMVPWSGGELFAGIKNAKKTAHIVHADLNAAQNLQRRFWGRCGEAFRITCKKVGRDGTDAYELDRKPGARLLGALQQLDNGDSAFLLVPERSGRFKSDSYVMAPASDRKVKIKASDDDITSEDDDLAEMISDLDGESGESRETLFATLLASCLILGAGFHRSSTGQG